MSLPSSKEEKLGVFSKTGQVQHWLFVHELVRLLQTFEPTDWVEVNKLGNLVVFREGATGKHVISMTSGEVEVYE